MEVPGAPYKTEHCKDGQGLAPVEGDCTSFNICDQDEVRQQKCPHGLYFNPGSKVCDWPANVDCDCVDCDSNEIGGGAIEDTGSDNDGQWKPDFEPIEAEDNNDGQWVPDSDKIVVEEPDCPATPRVGSGQKVVCYFTNWAWYRNGKGKYTPDHIDPALCTHINYGFAVLDSQRLVMKPHDTWADLDNKFYQKVTALKKCGIKVLIALGGWNDSAGDKYSRMVRTAASRKKFVDHAYNFVQEHNFDGLDLDWEYPKCWQVNCEKGPDSDKENFASLVRELRAKFDKDDLLLSAAVSPSKRVIDAGYDVKALSDNLDIINVMTYDYYGHWDKKTGHVAPMKDFEGAPHDVFNAVSDLIV